VSASNVANAVLLMLVKKINRIYSRKGLLLYSEKNKIKFHEKTAIRFVIKGQSTNSAYQ
jgi:hypothetical protein